MKVTVVRPDELGPAELECWRGLQRKNPLLGNPFLAPEFTLAVGRARPTARVAVLADGEQIVGFFPHERRGRFVGTAIGAGIADCQGLVCAPGLEWDAVELVRACGLPVFEYDHLVAGQDAFAPHHRVRIELPVMDLSGGYQAYLDDRLRAAKATIKDIQRRTRLFAREVDDIRFEYDSADPDVLAELFRWKSAQYRRSRVHDRFATPWIAQVVTDLLAARTPECTGTLSVLYAGGRPVAAHMGLRSDSVLSYWFPAYDPSFARYSVGLSLLLRMAEAAAAEGVDRVDLGPGPERYKDEMCSRKLEIAEGRVGASRTVAAVRETRAAVDRGIRRVRKRRPLRHVRRLGRFVRERMSR